MLRFRLNLKYGKKSFFSDGCYSGKLRVVRLERISFFGGPYLILPLGDTRKSFLRVATSGEPKALKYKSLKPKSKKESSHESKKREAKILKP